MLLMMLGGGALLAGSPLGGIALALGRVTLQLAHLFRFGVFCAIAGGVTMTIWL